MSTSDDVPLNHPSALIGLNVGLLVDRQTASVLWFLDRWWEELKVSTATRVCLRGSVCVCLCVDPECYASVCWKSGAGNQRTATSMFLRRSFKKKSDRMTWKRGDEVKNNGNDKHKQTKVWVWSCRWVTNFDCARLDLKMGWQSLHLCFQSELCEQSTEDVNNLKSNTQGGLIRADSGHESRRTHRDRRKPKTDECKPS